MERRFFLLFFLLLFTNLFFLIYSLYLNWCGYSCVVRRRELKEVFVPKVRGLIYDRNGEVLALSLPTLDLYAYKPYMLSESKRLALARALSRLIKVRERELLKRLREKKDYVILARGISQSLEKRLKALIISLNLSSFINYYYTSKRYYPYKRMLSNLLGFVRDYDSYGLEGLEFMLNKYLGYGRERLVLLRNKVLRVEVKDYSLPRAYLSLDLRLLRITEDIKRKIVKRFKPKGVVILLFSLKDGSILALSNYPDFDPQSYQRYKQEDFRLLAFQRIYEVGSTIKPLIVGYAVDRGLFSFSDLIDTSKPVKVGSKKIKDLSFHKSLTLSDVLVYSSNIGTIKVAKHLKEEDFKNIVKVFHLKEKTGAFVGEASSKIPDLRREEARLYMAIGQGIALTPIRLAYSFCSVANGKILKPILIKKILDSQGNTLYLAKGEVLTYYPLSEKTLRELRGVLVQVVERGTGVRAKSRYFFIAGKTGTAQKFINGKYSKEKLITYFVGFYPATRPKVCALIMVDEPKGKDLEGGKVCAPYFKELVERSAYVLKLKPDKKF